MARPGFRQHQKLRRLAHMLGLPLPYAWGLCECLWDCSYQSGNALIGDSLDVELAAEWPGEAGKLTTALLAVRLIDEVEPGKYQVHDLHENAPDFVKKRFARDQERKNQYAPRQRNRFAADGISPPNSADGQNMSELGQTHSTAQHSTAQHRDRTSCSVCPETPLAASSRPPASSKEGQNRTDQQPGEEPSSETPPVLTFPCDGTVKDWHLTQTGVAELRGLFPSLDVLAECRKALAWVLASPERKKTAKGMRKFITGWLSRSQDRGPARPAATGRPAGETLAERIERNLRERASKASGGEAG